MRKVLIVDDAPSILKIMETFLTLEGCNVTKASNAEAAIEKIKAQKFDIGIFDVNMPGKNGIELTKIALGMENGKDMKILILTTESSDSLRQQGIEAGASGWLLKPVKNEDLSAILNMLQ